MLAIVPDNTWNVSFIILSVQNFHYSFGSVSRAFWLLGEARVVLERLVNALFELQITDVPHGQRISSMVIVFSLKFNTAPISCKVCLPMIRLYNGGALLREYSTISGFK